MTTQSKTIWIAKTDRKSAKGNPFYVSNRAGESLTLIQGHAKTWTTQTGCARWIAQTGWAGHAEPVEREGLWIGPSRAQKV